MRAPEKPASDRPLRLVLLLDSGPVEVQGTVVRAEQTGDVFDVGIRFGELAQDAQDVIVSWCFRQPFGPDALLVSDHPDRELGSQAPVPPPTPRPRRRLRPHRAQRTVTP